MPEWLKPVADLEGALSTSTMALRLGLALLLGLGVAWIYRASHGRESDQARTLAATLVLLSVLIAMVSMVIGESVARAFGLVGALSIVRFRTVVEDTRDTAFVIFAVIVGMATGTGVLMVALVGLPIVGVAAMALARPGAAAEPAPACLLTIRLGLGRDPGQTVGAVLSRHTSAYRVLGAATARQGASLEVTYELRVKSDADQTALVMELNQVEGVQSVDLRRA